MPSINDHINLGLEIITIYSDGLNKIIFEHMSRANDKHSVIIMSYADIYNSSFECTHRDVSWLYKT